MLISRNINICINKYVFRTIHYGCLLPSLCPSILNCTKEGSWNKGPASHNQVKIDFVPYYCESRWNVNGINVWGLGLIYYQPSPALWPMSWWYRYCSQVFTGLIYPIYPSLKIWNCTKTRIPFWEKILLGNFYHYETGKIWLTLSYLPCMERASLTLCLCCYENATFLTNTKHYHCC